MEFKYQTEIKDPYGLYIGASMKSVDHASRYDSRIKLSIQSGDQVVDARSIMQTSMIAATCGTKLTVIASAEDRFITEEDLKNAATALGMLLSAKSFTDLD